MLWGQGGAEVRRRSDSTLICKAWPSFGSRGALSIRSVIVFMKKTYLLIFSCSPLNGDFMKLREDDLCMKYKRTMSHSQAVQVHSMKCSNL